MLNRSRALLASLLTAALLASPSYAFDTSPPGDSPSGDSSYSSGDSVPELGAAQALIKKKKYADAISVLRKIIDAKPFDAEALNLMGYSLRMNGNTKSALGFYKKALKLQPKHRGANEYLGELYVTIGQLDNARKQLRVLEGICGTSCEEYAELKKAIDGAS